MSGNCGHQTGPVRTCVRTAILERCCIAASVAPNSRCPCSAVAVCASSRAGRSAVNPSGTRRRRTLAATVHGAVDRGITHIETGVRGVWHQRTATRHAHARSGPAASDPADKGGTHPRSGSVRGARVGVTGSTQGLTGRPVGSARHQHVREAGGGRQPWRLSGSGADHGSRLSDRARRDSPRTARCR